MTANANVKNVASSCKSNVLFNSSAETLGSQVRLVRDLIRETKSTHQVKLRTPTTSKAVQVGIVAYIQSERYNNHENYHRHLKGEVVTEHQS